MAERNCRKSRIYAVNVTSQGLYVISVLCTQPPIDVLYTPSNVNGLANSFHHLLVSQHHVRIFHLFFTDRETETERQESITSYSALCSHTRGNSLASAMQKDRQNNQNCPL